MAFGGRAPILLVVAAFTGPHDSLALLAWLFEATRRLFAVAVLSGCATVGICWRGLLWPRVDFVHRHVLLGRVTLSFCRRNLWMPRDSLVLGWRGLCRPRIAFARGRSLHRATRQFGSVGAAFQGRTSISVHHSSPFGRAMLSFVVTAFRSRATTRICWCHLWRLRVNFAPHRSLHRAMQQFGLLAWPFEAAY